MAEDADNPWHSQLPASNVNMATAYHQVTDKLQWHSLGHHARLMEEADSSTAGGPER